MHAHTRLGVQHVLLCRVLLGESCLGTSSHRTPDPKPGSTKLYESMVNRIDDPSIFVLSTGSDAQCFPEFLLRVKRRPQIVQID